MVSASIYPCGWLLDFPKTLFFSISNNSLSLLKTNWEETAQQREEWRALCHQHINNFEDQRKKKMLKARAERKAPSTIQTSNLPFVCDICNKICKSKAGLHSHQRTQHPPSNPNPNSDDSRRTCRICGKVCKNEHGLKIHLRVHR